LKPKLSRQIVKSAKANLNRYWQKFEELLNVENTMRQKKVQRLNNKVSPAMDTRHIQDLNNWSNQKLMVEKNVSRGRYKHFMDDSLYYGVNLKPAVVLTTSPVNRYSFCCNRDCSPPQLPTDWTLTRRRRISFDEEENFQNEFNQFLVEEGSLV
jgi:hypothetical protein